MNKQQKDWAQRFIDTGEAADFIVNYLLDVEADDQDQMTNDDYGAYVRAKKTLVKQIRANYDSLQIEVEQAG